MKYCFLSCIAFWLTSTLTSFERFLYWKDAIFSVIVADQSLTKISMMLVSIIRCLIFVTYTKTLNTTIRSLFVPMLQLGFLITCGLFKCLC